ncbi:MAG: asparaginase [Eubacteriales bacterium]|nr:asparaginase [Eubacteriales bacterium]MDD3350406.1 asparaginase [Eubacteriales bacterium]
MRKKVCIIHTGGTIGMQKTAQGYAPQKGSINASIAEIKELSSEEMPYYDLIDYDPLLDSSKISIKEWVKIAHDIEERYHEYDGFVILHGTDTMAYTASALSFMLDGLDKPVIITGSQIPLCEIRNDARDNLIAALLIAAESQIPEVCLYFGNKLFRGNRATKISSDELIAFDSPNYPPLAEAGVRIEINKKELRKKGQKLDVKMFQNQQIAVLKIFPGIQFEVFENIVTDHLGGIVFEAFGVGNIPESDSLIRILRKAEKNGTVIVVCTQCLRGSVSIGTYEASSMLVESGAVSGYDMTVEAAVAKLYYLLSQGYQIEKVKKLMQTDLRGELS